MCHSACVGGFNQAPCPPEEIFTVLRLILLTQRLGNGSVVTSTEEGRERGVGLMNR